MSKSSFKALGSAELAAAAIQNLVVNPFMEFSQEIQGAASATSGVYSADQYYVSFIGPTITHQRIANPFPTMPEIGYGLRLRATTAKASLATGDYMQLVTKIEGGRWRRLAFGTSSAKPVAIGFIARSNIAGTFTVGIRNAAVDRTFQREFTLQANTDTLVPLFIPGCTDGVWPTDTTAACYITFGFGAGATFLAAKDTWVNGSGFVTAATTNLGAAVNNEIVISGLVMLPGTDLPAKDQWHLLTRQYEDEEALCKRYYQRIKFSQRLYSTGSGTVGWMAVPYSPMRATPSGSFVSRAGLSAIVSSTTFFPQTELSGINQIVSNAAGDLWIDIEHHALQARI